MDSLHSLLTLLQHQQDERDAALAACQRARLTEQQAQTQAEQLQAYRGDYERRWQAQFGQGGDMSIVLCYQSFTARLTQAIEQQRVQCQHLGAMRERTEQLLLERERDVASTAKLIERRRAEMSRAADRRERKAEDEMAARLAARAQRSSAFHG